MRIDNMADVLMGICQKHGDRGAQALMEVRQPLDRLIDVEHNIGKLMLLRREEIDHETMVARANTMLDLKSGNVQRLVLVGHGEPARGISTPGDQRLLGGLKRCGSGNPDLGLAMKHKFGFFLAIKRLMPGYPDDMATRASCTIAAGILHMVALHVQYNAMEPKVQQRIAFMRTFNDDPSMRSPIVGTRGDVLVALCT